MSGAGELVDPDMIPRIDTEFVYDAANELLAMATTVSERTASIKATWEGLSAPGVYEAPESETVYGLLDPATEAADEVEDAYVGAARVLKTYAAELDTIKQDLDSVREAAEKFRTKALNYDPLIHTSGSNDWSTSGRLVDENAQILSRINDVVARIVSAEGKCSNDIHSYIPDICFDAQPTTVTGG